MEVLLLAPELCSSPGGIPRCLRTYLRALCEDTTHDGVHVVALNDPSLTRTMLEAYAPRALRDPVGCGRGKLSFLAATLWRARHCQRLVCGHVHLMPVARLAKLIRRDLAVYVIAHGVEVWHPLTGTQRRSLRAAQRIWCVSDYTRRQVLAFNRVSRDRLAVLPNALDPALAPPPAQALLAPEPGRLLTIARLARTEKRKGLDHLIDALPVLKRLRPDAQLIVVGDGDDRTRLATRATELGVDGMVRFKGYLEDKALRNELARCHAFVLPSAKEGFGLVYLEAMAHGRPCVAAGSGGVPEVVGPHQGILVEYGDVPGLAQACASALDQAWDAEALQRHADKFSYTRFRERLATLW